MLTVDFSLQTAGLALIVFTDTISLLMGPKWAFYKLLRSCSVIWQILCPNWFTFTHIRSSVSLRPNVWMSCGWRDGSITTSCLDCIQEAFNLNRGCSLLHNQKWEKLHLFQEFSHAQFEVPYFSSSSPYSLYFCSSTKAGCQKNIFNTDTVTVFSYQGQNYTFSDTLLWKMFF